MHPRRAPRALLLLAIAALAAIALVLGGRPASAIAASSAGVALPAPAAPDFSLEGGKWTRPVVDVYYSWAGGDCILDGDNFSGPAAPVAPAVATAQLRAAIDEINVRLRGALRLVLVGEVPRTTLCGRSRDFPIVVGWGAFASDARGGTAKWTTSVVPSGQVAPILFARVFVKNDQAWTCPVPDPDRHLRHVIEHELLHTLGIGHSAVEGAAMAPASVICGAPRVLQPDDIAALAALYPPPPGPSTNEPAAAPVAVSSGTFAAAPVFGAAGQALVVFLGGSVGQLEAAATQERATGVWAQDAVGVYYLDVIGGPTFINAAFRARFATGFAGPTAVTLTR